MELHGNERSDSALDLINPCTEESEEQTGEGRVEGKARLQTSPSP
jgi:hypothetical protein